MRRRLASLAASVAAPEAGAGAASAAAGAAARPGPLVPAPSPAPSPAQRSPVMRWSVRGGPASEQSGSDAAGLPALGAARFFSLPAQFLLGLGSERSVQQCLCGGLGQAPHIAFAGRSNVGKSTLLNALFGKGATGASKLARTSKTPGRTQAVNLYGLGRSPSAPELVVADMPGYGFALEAGHGKARRWNQALGLYVRTTAAQAVMRRLFLLVDSRRGLMDIDLDFMRFLDGEGAPYQLVLTKCDRVSRAELLRAVDQALVFLRAPGRSADPPFVLSVSSRDRAGLVGLRREVISCAVVKKSGRS